ncbi:uncharacterized protein LOC131230751 [Magnolia sinica]|uniref:uncharacterized protein LOC131230751 n=1 Tax=Magnolia sinica TaxID=86752 RepID=UPI00265B0CF5|nr:uncharacterized protein LOC131230751 [Magnolia sinica]
MLASKGLKLGLSGSASQHTGKSSSKASTSSDGLKCFHCGNTNHTRENCFQLHGYPDWWHELQARKKRDGTAKGAGKAVMATAEPYLSLIPPTASPKSDFSPADPDILTKEIIGRGTKRGDYTTWKISI